MAKFFKNLFSTSSANISPAMNEDKKVKEKKEVKDGDENKEFSAPYDTRRKLSISRSGRMKQNNKNRGKLGGDLYGEIPHKIEKTSIEYHVNKRDFFADDPPGLQHDKKSEGRVENLPSIEKNRVVNDIAPNEPTKNDTVIRIENDFKYLESLDDENTSDSIPSENTSKLKETTF